MGIHCQVELLNRDLFHPLSGDGSDSVTSTPKRQDAKHPPPVVEGIFDIILQNLLIKV